MATYRLDLRLALPTMTWRRFRVLLDHLPPDSILALHLYARAEREREAAMAQPEALEAHLTSLGW